MGEGNRQKVCWGMEFIGLVSIADYICDCYGWIAFWGMGFDLSGRGVAAGGRGHRKQWLDHMAIPCTIAILIAIRSVLPRLRPQWRVAQWSVYTATAKI